MSLNDPQWGKRPGGGSGGGNGGPPDLDEIWRNFNRRLNDLLNRRPGGSGSSEPPGGGGFANFRPNLPLSGAGLLVLLVLAVWLASGFYIVDEGRRGVVTRFGKYTETALPGPRWHLPFPVEAVDLVDFSQVKTIEIGYTGSPRNKVDKEALMLTDDENIIEIQFAVQYNIKSAESYLFNVRRPDLVVKFIAQAAMGEVVGKAKMDFALYEGREQIAKSAEKLMQELLDRYKTGIYVQKVTLQNVQPPDKVQAAFDDAVKAGQDRERFRNEGQAYANDVVPRARGNASRLLEEARGYQAEVTQRAEGDASRFKQILVEYTKAPAVTRERLYLDMMQSVVGGVNKVVIDQKAGNSLLYLPLDKLIQQSGASVAAAPAAAPAPAPTPEASPQRPAAAESTAIDPGRSRDALRARDRGGDAR